MANKPVERTKTMLEVKDLRDFDRLTTGPSPPPLQIFKEQAPGRLTNWTLPTVRQCCGAIGGDPRRKAYSSKDDV